MAALHTGGARSRATGSPDDDHGALRNIRGEAGAEDLEAAPEGGARGRRAAERAGDFAIRVGPDVEPRVVAERIGEPRLLRRGRPSTLDGIILYGKIPSWLNKTDLCKMPTVMIEPIREPDFPCCRVCCDNAPVAVTGTTIAEKVTRLRIDRAKQLLKASNVSLERIATACGFYNASHLSAAFLRCVGVRPSVFRDSL